MDTLPVKNTSPDDLRAKYAFVKKNIYDYSIAAANIWNMDETGLSVGACLNDWVLGSLTKKRTYKKEPADSCEWVSILEILSVEGTTTRPVVIFKGKNLQSSWFQCKIPD
jgi:hypothetical protein